MSVLRSGEPVMMDIVDADVIGPGERRNMPVDEFADYFHDAYVDYDTMRQEAEGTTFEGFIDLGNRRYPYRALLEGSSGFQLEDEQQIAGNFIANVDRIDGAWVFEGCIPGRFRVNGPVRATYVQVKQDPSHVRRWLRWRPISG